MYWPPEGQSRLAGRLRLRRGAQDDAKQISHLRRRSSKPQLPLALAVLTYPSFSAFQLSSAQSDPVHEYRADRAGQATRSVACRLGSTRRWTERLETNSGNEINLITWPLGRRMSEICLDIMRF